MYKKVLYIFILAFISNLIWENLHVGLYAHHQGGAISQTVLLEATLFDAVFITILAIPFFFIAFLQKRLWLAAAISIIVAIFIEIFGISTGQWAYTKSMPIIPLLGTGLTPTIQLGLLSYLIYRIVGLGSVRSSNR